MAIKKKLWSKWHEYKGKIDFVDGTVGEVDYGDGVGGRAFVTVSWMIEKIFYNAKRYRIKLGKIETTGE